MSTALEIVAALLGLSGAVAGVLYYLRRAESTSVDLAQTGAALNAEESHVAALEAAAAAKRHERRVGFDVKVAAAKSPADVADLLRDVTADSDKTK